jgi:hypothetical protein
LEIREDMRSIYPCNQAKIAAGGATLSGTPVKIDTIRYLHMGCV